MSNCKEISDMLLKKIKRIAILLTSAVMLNSCSDYLDLVPDDRLATIEYAFAMRTEAKKYLYTCYSYMPHNSYIYPEFFGGDEYGLIFNNLFTESVYNGTYRLARGLQNAANPIAGDDWFTLYRALRICNVFLENVGSVPDLDRIEREQWTGEVLFLKAYYHFYLLRKWGPIPLVKENISISAGTDEVKVSRNTVDECFGYIKELLDEAIPLLPIGLDAPTQDLGRITRPIAAAFKAQVMVYAASPLFNNNDDQATLKNHDGTLLFTTGLSEEEEKAKWDSAVVACREAIRLCSNHSMFEFQTSTALPDTIQLEMNIRGALTQKYNNSEHIWVNTQTSSSEIEVIQRNAMVNLDENIYPDVYVITPILNPALKIVQMYYTNNGIPIEDDKNWQTLDPMAFRKGDEAHKYYIRKDYTTIQLNFDREPRFYAHLGFDGGIWFRQKEALLGSDPSKYKCVETQPGGINSSNELDAGHTGYFAKKLVHYEKVALNNSASLSVTDYLWPLIRLSDLYLLYAEAINESEGPNGPNSADLFFHIDAVRAKNGLKGVKESWSSEYAITAAVDKYKTQSGMREIIRRERLIELSLEGHRFWDIRRWKIAPAEYAKKITGLNIRSNNIAEYYTPVTFMEQTFAIRDYFWPIRTSNIEQNPNLVQNLYWN
jgi:hypothetical protein